MQAKLRGRTLDVDVSSLNPGPLLHLHQGTTAIPLHHSRKL